MNLRRLGRLLLKDIAMGPRNPIFIYAIVIPLGLTLILQVAFGTLFEPSPRMGIVDEGSSEITKKFENKDGIELTLLEDVNYLMDQVENNDLDAGMFLPTRFDEKVLAGEKPKLDLFIGGESLASHRIILSVMTMDILRDVEGSDIPVTVELIQFGEEGLPISMRLVPLIVFYALAMAGIFLPGSSIVEEKEKETLMALLVTPARKNEVLAAKGLLGIILSSLTALLTLFLNNALGPRPLDVMLVILVAATLSSLLGVLVGLLAKTSTSLFAIIKGAGIILFAPVIFYIFPDWPQWIARIFPLYWIIEPIWEVSVMGNPVSNVSFELFIAGGIIIALTFLTMSLGRYIKFFF